MTKEFLEIYNILDGLNSKDLFESQSQEIGAWYKKLSKRYNIDLDELVYGKDGFMNSYYPNGFPDWQGDLIYNEKYWNEFERWLKETRGIILQDNDKYADLAEGKEFGKGDYWTDYSLFSVRDARNRFDNDIVSEEYFVIDSNKAYDPEGLYIDEGIIKTVKFAGTKEECEEYLERLKKQAHERVDREQNSYSKTIIIEDEGKDFIKIYYPLAISRSIYQIIKNTLDSSHLTESKSSNSKNTVDEINSAIVKLQDGDEIKIAENSELPSFGKIINDELIIAFYGQNGLYSYGWQTVNLGKIDQDWLSAYRKDPSSFSYFDSDTAAKIDAKNQYLDKKTQKQKANKLSWEQRKKEYYGKYSANTKVVDVPAKDFFEMFKKLSPIYATYLDDDNVYNEYSTFPREYYINVKLSDEQVAEYLNEDTDEPLSNLFVIYTIESNDFNIFETKDFELDIYKDFDNMSLEDIIEYISNDAENNLFEYLNNRY